MTIPLPDIPDTGKITDGNDRMSETRQAVNTLAARVTPLSLGGTSGTTKPTARAGIGITSGTSLPGVADEGDVFFLVV